MAFACHWALLLLGDPSPNNSDMHQSLGLGELLGVNLLHTICQRDSHPATKSDAPRQHEPRYAALLGCIARQKWQLLGSRGVVLRVYETTRGSSLVLMTMLGSAYVMGISSYPLSYQVISTQRSEEGTRAAHQRSNQSRSPVSYYRHPAAISCVYIVATSEY